MLNRRQIIAGLLPLTATPPGSYAEVFSREMPRTAFLAPPEEGYAANLDEAWVIEDADRIQLVAAAPDILPAVIDKLASIPPFSSGDQIDKFFLGTTGASYIDWYNSQIGGRLWWKERTTIGGSNVRTNFTEFWRAYLSSQSIDLITFIALMSIFTNERSGNLVDLPEQIGAPGHPGISYLFDKIDIVRSNGRRFRKRSYNFSDRGSNKTAWNLFNDPLFNDSHANLSGSAGLIGSKDQVWNGILFPSTRFNTSNSPMINGYLLETDFFKFRGRGVFQTTWRANYLNLVKYIQSYSGDDQLIRYYKMKWAGMDPDEVCTRSKSADWDRLFQDNGRVILCQAVREHARTSGYLPLVPTSLVLNGGSNQPGSLLRMGLRIGGSPDYASIFKARVGQICNALYAKLNGTQSI